MKTRTNILLIISLTILLSLHLNAAISFFTSTTGKENIEIEYVNSNNIDEALLLEFNFEEEEYIDDIPFNTDCVTAQCKYEKAMSVDFNFEEEEYIDDMDGLNL